MRPLALTVTLTRTLALASAVALPLACGSVPVDNQGANNRLFPASGVVQGSVVYSGPHPCSAEGHIVGNAILLFFRQDDPPPPRGTASTAVNFGVVSGDSLFTNEPRFGGKATYCPKDHGETGTITASAPFAVSPFDAGTYIIEAFFDYTGDFLPGFKFRNLPEKGDVGGGYIDTADALMHAGDVNYQPIFLPVTVGVPGHGASAGGGGGDSGADGGAGGALAIPDAGYVAGNVTVTMGEVLPLARPYFYPTYPGGADTMPTKSVATTANPSGDAAYVPVATMAQDLHVLAAPAIPTQVEADKAQASFVSVKLNAGVPSAELSAATDPAGPFHFQLGASAGTSLFLWSSGTGIPESSLVPSLYPQVVFTKLVDDPKHTNDPQSLLQQTEPTGPVVIILGITLDKKDSLFDTAFSVQPKAPGPTAETDHVTALVRPTAICLDPNNPGAGATLVTPFFTGTSSNPAVKTPQPPFDPAAVTKALAPLFGNVNIVQGCLPTGRFAMNLVYPTGQAWTVPNETGSCAATEGSIQWGGSGGGSGSGALPACSVVPAGEKAGRQVLFSQGTRGVLEVVASPGSATCAMYPVPAACQ